MNKNDVNQLQKKLKKEGRLVFKVVTGSMEPLIPVNSLIEVAPIEGRLEIFDVVLFKCEDRLICHFIWHINRDGTIVTRGLRSGEDFPVPSEHIVGRVMSHRIGWWARLRMKVCSR